MHTPTQTSSELEMSYTKEDFSRDWDEICRMAASDKPDDIHQLVQWEMARTHKALVEYWVQVEKVCGLSWFDLDTKHLALKILGIQVQCISDVIDASGVFLVL